MTGWLHTVARLNPLTNILRLARVGFLGDIVWADCWGGLVASVGHRWAGDALRPPRPRHPRQLIELPSHAMSGASGPVTVTHVLLDLDGTLSDSEPGILRSLQWACEVEGFPIPDEAQVRSVIGPPFEIGLPSIGIPDDALFRVIKTYRERYETIGLFENTLYDGIVAMLDQLAAAGLSLSIATAKPERTAVRILEHFGLTERFEFIVGATLTQERRAKHQIITHVLEPARSRRRQQRGDGRRP